MPLQNSSNRFSFGKLKYHVWDGVSPTYPPTTVKSWPSVPVNLAIFGCRIFADDYDEVASGELLIQGDGIVWAWLLWGGCRQCKKPAGGLPAGGAGPAATPPSASQPVELGEPVLCDNGGPAKVYTQLSRAHSCIPWNTASMVTPPKPERFTGDKDSPSWMPKTTLLAAENRVRSCRQCLPVCGLP